MGMQLRKLLSPPLYLQGDLLSLSPARVVEHVIRYTNIYAIKYIYISIYINMFKCAFFLAIGGFQPFGLD